MFSYNIAKEASNEIFKKTCAQIESMLGGLKKDEPLIDVDGSVIQTYKTPHGSIKIYNDYEVDAVYCDSEVDLNEILNKSTAQ